MPILSYSAISKLTEADAKILSDLFPKSTRSHLIALRGVLSNRKESWRTYAHGLVSIDEEAMLTEVSLKCSLKTADRVSLLIDRGGCSKLSQRHP
ncbi:hypothetical protein SAMN03159293_04739 [Pseudomonas sp. NFACC39-1]|nr:hypothetical protein SAMN03159293_04739 [Pseudomonas sp. NFACC39-1]